MQSDFTTGMIRPIECVKEGFRLIKQDYWLLFAVSIIGIFVSAFSFYILSGAMFCGILLAFLRVFDGERAQFDDLWKGFSLFGKSIGAVAAIFLPAGFYIVAVVMTIYLPLLALAISGGKISGAEMMPVFLVALVIDAIVAFLMVAIHSLLIFTFPLIAERGMSSWPAIKLSARATMQNLSGIAGLFAVHIGIAIAGYAAFCVGIYLAVPLIIATNLAAYRQVFPKTPTALA